MHALIAMLRTGRAISWGESEETEAKLVLASDDAGTSWTEISTIEPMNWPQVGSGFFGGGGLFRCVGRGEWCLEGYQGSQGVGTPRRSRAVVSARVWCCG